MTEPVVCSVEGCGKPKRTKGMCNACYEYMRLHGTTDRPRVRQGTPPELRIWEFVDKDGPVPVFRPELGQCWLWTGSLNVKGYGMFHWSATRNIMAHRAVWLVSGRDLADELQLDHLCRVPQCVNPVHMEEVTNAENMARAKAAWETCRKGHPRTPENLVTIGGKQFCRECKDARFERFYEKHGGRDGYYAGRHPLQPKTHCPAGHPYDEANTRILANGTRLCKACRRARRRAKKQETGVWA